MVTVVVAFLATATRRFSVIGRAAVQVASAVGLSRAQAAVVLEAGATVTTARPAPDVAARFGLAVVGAYRPFLAAVWVQGAEPERAAARKVVRSSVLSARPFLRTGDTAAVGGVVRGRSVGAPAVGVRPFVGTPRQGSAPAVRFPGRA